MRGDVCIHKTFVIGVLLIINGGENPAIHRVLVPSIRQFYWLCGLGHKHC